MRKMGRTNSSEEYTIPIASRLCRFITPESTESPDSLAGLTFNLLREVAQHFGEHTIDPDIQQIINRLTQETQENSSNQPSTESNPPRFNSPLIILEERGKNNTVQFAIATIEQQQFPSIQQAIGLRLRVPRSDGSPETLILSFFYYENVSDLPPKGHVEELSPTQIRIVEATLYTRYTTKTVYIPPNVPPTWRYDAARVVAALTHTKLGENWQAPKNKLPEILNGPPMAYHLTIRLDRNTDNNNLLKRLAEAMRQRLRDKGIQYINVTRTIG